MNENDTNSIELINGNPFKGLKICEKWRMLATLGDRSPCPKCNKSRKYFCYTCYIPVNQLENHIPKMRLPVKIDIMKHAREINGKSTAVHAAVLAPKDVRIFMYPCIPDYDTSNERVVLIFPGKDALSVAETVAAWSMEDGEEPGCKKPRTGAGGGGAVQVRAVFIDSTWNQSRGIYKDSRLRGEDMHSSAMCRTPCPGIPILAAPGGQPTLVSVDGGSHPPVPYRVAHCHQKARLRLSCHQISGPNLWNQPPSVSTGLIQSRRYESGLQWQCSTLLHSGNGCKW